MRGSKRADPFLPTDGTQVTSRRPVAPRETAMSSTLSLCLKPILTATAGRAQAGGAKGAQQ